MPLYSSQRIRSLSSFNFIYLSRILLTTTQVPLVVPSFSNISFSIVQRVFYCYRRLITSIYGYPSTQAQSTSLFVTIKIFSTTSRHTLRIYSVISYRAIQSAQSSYKFLGASEMLYTYRHCISSSYSGFSPPLGTLILLNTLLVVICFKTSRLQCLYYLVRLQ